MEIHFLIKMPYLLTGLIPLSLQHLFVWLLLVNPVNYVYEWSSMVAKTVKLKSIKIKINSMLGLTVGYYNKTDANK